MSDNRSRRRENRRRVHLAMRLPVVHVSHATGVQTATYARRFVTDRGEMGNLKGGDWAQMSVLKPKLLFWLEDLEEVGVVAEMNDTISFWEGEAYTLENSEERDDQTQKWTCYRIDPARASGLPVPEE